MIIKLYNFTKRINSTLQPNNDGLSVSVNLKNDTSIYTPIFLLSVDNIETYNYLKWNDRYYYIDDIIKSNIAGVWEINCTIDVLATYKNDILNSSGFVLYSASTHDPYIKDNRLTVDEIATVSANHVNMVDFAPNAGTYVVTYVSSQSILAPVGIAFLNSTQIRALGTELLSDGFVNTLVELQKQLSDAKSCLISCTYIPISLASGITSKMILGTYSSNVDCVLPTSKVITYESNITIPWQYTDFRNLDPYTDLLLYLPAYGFTSLNAADYIDKTTINVRCVLDVITGEATYIVDSKYRFTTTFGQSIALGSNRTDLISGITQAVGGTIAAGAGLISGNALAAVGGAGAIFNSMIVNNKHSIGTNGSMGGISSILANISADEGGDIYAITISHNTNITPDSINNVNGRPLNQVKTISDLSGYVQTADFSVISNAPEQLKSQINNYMNGGVYIE